MSPSFATAPRLLAAGRIPAACETDRPATALPVSARIEQADWLETFLAFAPVAGWSEVHSAFLVPRVQFVFAFEGTRAAGRCADDRGRMRDASPRPFRYELP